METQFENHISKVNKILRNIGMSIDREDSNRTLLNRLKHHWKCSLHLIVFIPVIVGEIVWIVMSVVTGRNMLETTYMIPCTTLCLLGVMRLGSVIYYIDSINDLIISLKTLDSIKSPNDKSIENVYRTWVNFLTNIIKLLLFLTYCGAAAFLSMPFLIMGTSYYTTGEFTLMLPFMSYYPFDEFDIHYWPFVYIQQGQSAWMAINSVVGPDCFFFTCCTFIHLQFVILQQKLKQIVKKDLRNSKITHRHDQFIEEFVGMVNRHRELIRCVELLDAVYSKGTLFNVVTSSLIICATGFNLKAFDDFFLVVPFISFLFFGMVQVFLHCYYGDCVMRSSMQVGDAIYNSRWYNAGVPVRKCLLIVLLRSQKPCKFTAYGFTDVNLATFTRILSTSWSYFALLNQIYHDGN